MDTQAEQMRTLQQSIDRLQHNLSDMTIKYTELISRLLPNTNTNTNNPSKPPVPDTILTTGHDNYAATDADMDIENNTSTELPTTSTADSMHAPQPPASSNVEHKPTQQHPRPWNVTAAAKQNITLNQPQSNTKARDCAKAVATPQPARTTRKSYAEIASQITANKDQANVEAAKSALGFFHQKRVPSKSQTEQRLSLRRIYVNGIPRTTYKNLKTHLFSLRFMLSKIVNISYIAQNCVEFLVREEYASSFIKRCNDCNLKIIEVDPTKPLDPNFPVDQLPAVRELFKKRLTGLITNTNSDIVKQFFEQFAAEQNITLTPITNPSTSAEPMQQ